VRTVDFLLVVALALTATASMVSAYALFMIDGDVRELVERPTMVQCDCQ
jgi:hypothetical protein